MIRFELSVDDLANAHFGISPLAEAVRSLRALVDPAQHTIHLPWLRTVSRRLDPEDVRVLAALVGASRRPADFQGHPSRAIADFLTPLPNRFFAQFDEQLEALRTTPPETVRRGLLASHAPDRVPEPLKAAEQPYTRAVRKLLDTICDALEQYWKVAIAPIWPQMQLILEADTTYRARQLAIGGAQLLFADIHPNIAWGNGMLSISEMMGNHTVQSTGRGLLLMPSIFATKPVPPIDPGEPPSLAYPSRGVATLSASPPKPDGGALVDLLGRSRALLLRMLDEPVATAEIARRLHVTSSAVSQHLRALHASGLVSRTRDRRQVLYRCTPLGDQLAGRPLIR